MRTRSLLGAWLVLSLAASCASPPNTTELDVSAPGERGATVSYAGESVVLDAQGHGVLTVPTLRVIASGFGVSVENVVVDAQGNEVHLVVARGEQSVNVVPQCVPVFTDEGPAQIVELRLQRLMTDGSCWLSNPSVVQRGTRVLGDYDPTHFDDQPCGPFR